MFALIARWTIPAEHRQTVMNALERMTAEVEAKEPGCLMYHSNISGNDENVIVLYERYVDQAAFDLHASSEHFKTIVLGEIVPLLAHREREYLIPVH